MDTCTQADQASAPKSRSANSEWIYSEDVREHERLKEEVKSMIALENCGWMKLDLDNDMVQSLQPKDISSLTLWDISTLKQYRQILAAYLIWAWHLIILSHFRKSQSPSAVVTEKTSHDSCEEEGRNECSICLVKIDEQEHEIKKLINCGHKFHQVCLDGWVSRGEINCPLCRRHLTEKVQVQAVQPLLKFCSLGSSHRGSDAWWLR